MPVSVPVLPACVPVFRRSARALSALSLLVALVACEGDTVDERASPVNAQTDTGGTSGGTAAGGGTSGGGTSGGGTSGGGASGGGASGGSTVAGGDTSGGGTDGGGDGGPSTPPGGDIALALPNVSGTLIEGGEALVLSVGVTRTGGHALPVTLEAEADVAGGNGLAWAFAATTLGAGESATTLRVELPIGPAPRRPGARTLVVTASDSAGARVRGEIAIDTVPTERPDIYLLAGQSNMVGSSRELARQAGPGEPDAPDPRVRQLDVTINDGGRYPTPASYTDIATIAAPDRRIVEALDPLHDIRDRGNDTKSGTTIGLGLTFGKAALADTTAEVVLVPSAWSDTGFCRRETNRFRGSGWNARAPESTALAGTLLYDRAVARANLAIAETGGILRGILWHQGEADSDSLACAQLYERNLRDMVAGMRTDIAPDARGEAARGPEADIPFIVGTMSKGDDERGPAMAPFGEIKSIVDGVHRNVASIVPLSDVVIADDLVPEAYPCGQGFCIHYGAEALRELGTRYHERLRAVLEAR